MLPTHRDGSLYCSANDYHSLFGKCTVHKTSTGLLFAICITVCVCVCVCVCVSMCASVLFTSVCCT